VPKVDAFFSNLTLLFCLHFRYRFMTLQNLDFLTMWLAFSYGALLFFVLETPWMKKVERRYPESFLILRHHQPIAFFCLWFGGLWILQDIFLKV
jgi:hypothetical protein